MLKIFTYTGSPEAFDHGCFILTSPIIQGRLTSIYSTYNLTQGSLATCSREKKMLYNELLFFNDTLNSLPQNIDEMKF